ncbi:hypothetical protein E1281_00185 [Actinomadura sp. KC345]|nr:hypothetical protein E1281_00185 [Actinomadura sp. KC345]
MRVFNVVPPGARTPVLVVLVLVLLVGGGWVLVTWVRPLFAPAYKTQFLIDGTMTSGGPEAVTASLRKAVGNAAADDALALRTFGGECGFGDNTEQLVGFGTGNREEVARATGEVSWGGKPTLVRGVVEAVDDFSKRLAWGADQHGTRVNRLIVVTRHGTDACEDDPAVVQREIHDRLESAGLKVEFKVIGYQVPEGERERLRQISAGIRGDAPIFASDPSRLAAAMEWFTNTQPVLREARKVTDVLNLAVGRVEDARTAIDEGGSTPPATSSTGPNRRTSARRWSRWRTGRERRRRGTSTSRRGGCPRSSGASSSPGGVCWRPPRTADPATPSSPPTARRS